MPHVRSGVIVGALLTLLVLPAAARAVCPGDCDGSGTVQITELIRGVNIALGSATVAQCTAFDTNMSGTVTVNELIAAVLAALNECPIETPTPTPTVAVEPIFPADYRNTFVEVRDCRFSSEHSGAMIRVFANDIAAEPYRREENPLPVGSILVKEEFQALSCDSDADLAEWSVMRKETPGFDPEDGDWHWQQLEAPSRSVICDGKNCPVFPCLGCHSQPDCLVRDYMCTVDDTPRGTLGTVLEALPAAVLSIAGRSPTDVYAVGADPNDGRGPLVLHYNGASWRRLDSGVTGAALWWISVEPIGGDFYMAGENGVIVQFDPQSGEFNRHTTPSADVTLFGIWGPSATDLWAVGGDEEQKAVVWRFQGESWEPQDVSAVVPTGVPTTLNKVWGRSAQDVYAVGETGVVIRFNGTAWSLVPSGVSTPLFTVHGNATVTTAVGGFQTGQILERTDGGFTSRTPSGTPRLNGVFVPSNGDAVAVGISLSVAARDSSGWTLVDEGTDSQLRDFHSVWIDSEDGIWAVGGDLSFLTNGIVAYGGPQEVAGGPIQ